MRRKRHLWLACSLVLLLAAFWATRDRQEKVPPTGAVEFPRKQQPWEAARALERRKPIPLRTATKEGAEEEVRQVGEEPRDPVLSAFPGGEDLAVVLEVNAIRHSPVVTRLLDCMPTRIKEELRKMEEETGIDPLQDIDRVAFLGEATAISGFFGEMRRDAFDSRNFGDRGVLLKQDESPFVALWNDEILLLARKQSEVEDAIHRLEGRLPSAPAIPSESAYGEVYGRMGPDMLSRILSDLPEVASVVGSAVQNIELHANVQQNVGLVLDVQGDDRMEDLMKIARGTIAASRITAREQGDADAEMLLELAKVNSNGAGTFSLELAVPDDLLTRLIDMACADLAAETDPGSMPNDPPLGAEVQ